MHNNNNNNNNIITIILGCNLFIVLGGRLIPWQFPIGVPIICMYGSQLCSRSAVQPGGGSSSPVVQTATLTKRA
jgi:hypothetical protein